MFRSKTTITRPDRDHLLRAARSKVNLLRWGLFVDELLREIDRARVVPPARVRPDVVTMHSTVRIRDVEHAKPEVYTLVYPDDAAPRLGKLSVLTPVGTALLGARVGDVVRVATVDGVRRIRVEAILYQPEADTLAGRLPCPGSGSGPAPTDDEALAGDARLARTRRALRRARRGELVIVYVMAAAVMLTVLPVLIAAASIWAATVLSRRLLARRGRRQRDGLPHADPPRLTRRTAFVSDRLGRVRSRPRPLYWGGVTRGRLDLAVPRRDARGIGR